MAFKPGKPKTGGRQKGVPNKSTQDLLLICEQEGVDPFRAMIHAFKELELPLDKMNALEKICQYLYPKRKAIEHSGEGEGFKVVIEDYRGKK